MHIWARWVFLRQGLCWHMKQSEGGISCSKVELFSLLELFQDSSAAYQAGINIFLTMSLVLTHTHRSVCSYRHRSFQNRQVCIHGVDIFYLLVLKQREL